MERELAVDTEDSDAGRQLVEHATVRFGHAHKFGSQRFGLGAIDGHAGAAGSARGVDYVEHAAHTRGDGRESPDIGLAGGART